MPTHLQHDLYIETIQSIASAIAITLQVGPTQEPYWRAIHRCLRQPPNPPLMHCPDVTAQTGSSPPTLRVTLMIKPIPPDSPLDHAATECYMAWLNAYTSPQYEETHERSKQTFWAMMDAIADQYVGANHHSIQDSQSLSRFVSTISQQNP